MKSDLIASTCILELGSGFLCLRTHASMLYVFPRRLKCVTLALFLIFISISVSGITTPPFFLNKTTFPPSHTAAMHASILLTLLYLGPEGCLTAGLVSIALSSLVVSLPVPFPIKLLALVSLMGIIYFTLKKWEKNSKAPVISRWNTLNDQNTSTSSQGMSAVIISLQSHSSDQIAEEVRVQWEGQSWAAKIVTASRAPRIGESVSVIGRDGTFLLVSLE